MGVILCEVDVFDGFLSEFSHLSLFQRFSCAIKERADGFEGFTPSAFLDFLSFEFKFEETRATIKANVLGDS